MTEVYSVESRKGGVGKTTIALNLAKALVKKKYDVLLIDCDITGTPITKAAVHSSFWKNDVVVAMDKGEPYNLIDFYDRVYLKGKIEEDAIIAGLEYNPHKIHLIGTEIYDNDGSLIIDPRDLMDDIHSYWFLDLLKNIIREFCDATKQANKAIVLDNSPGYVGIGRSVREWLTRDYKEKAKFMLVSSLDEQDIDSTIMSAAEIGRMMGVRGDAEQYIKIVINKVPEDLLEEGGGYEFKAANDENLKYLVDALFPLDKKTKYPKNIVKYDSAISSQFIEANIIPVKQNADAESDLSRALRTLEKKVASYEYKQDPYSDVSSIDYYYRRFLKELNDCGYVRMSKSLRGELFPNGRMKSLSDVVGKLGNMAHTDSRIAEFTRGDLKESGLKQLYRFIDYRDLSVYTPIFVSLYDGIYKVAGYKRNEANIYQMFNLNVILSAFYVYQEEYYHCGNDYRAFLKEEIANRKVRRFEDNLLRGNELFVTEQESILMDDYIRSLLKAHFSKFYQAMNTALLGMIDCKNDYELVIDACKDTMSQGAKMMSEDLLNYVKNVVARKTEDYDPVEYKRLVSEPYEMKAIQTLIKNYVFA